MKASALRSLLLCVTLAAPALATADTIAPLHVQRLGILTHDEPGQPSVAVDPREGFVLTWQQRTPKQTSLWFAVLDLNGRELRRNRIAAGKNWFVNWADFPSLAVLENGDWVTHYLEKSAGSTYAYEVRIVRSSDRGGSWSKPITPHTDGTPTQHGFVSLAPLNGDRVLAVWLDGRRGAGAHHEDGPMTLRSVILDRRGARHEERELDDSTCSCCQTDAARIAGSTVIAYRDRSDEEIRDIATVARSSEGSWTAPKTLSEDGWKIEGCPVNGPGIATKGERLLSVWPTQASGRSEVRYTIGTSQGARGVYTLDAGGALGRVDAAAWQHGWLVSWLGGDKGDAGLQVARLDGRGRILSRDTVVRLSPARISGNPRLAVHRDRGLLAWIEPEAVTKRNALGLALLRESLRDQP